MRHNTEDKVDKGPPSPQKTLARAQRGEIPPGFEGQFIHASDDTLIHLLQHVDAQNRTAGATLLGQRKCCVAIPRLCDGLRDETALYA